MPTTKQAWKPNSVYWEEKELKRRWEILKGQTSNQMIEILIARIHRQKIDFKDFNEFLEEYEKQFPRLLEVNQKLILGEEASSPWEVQNAK